MRSCELTQHIIVRFGSLRRYPVVHHRLPMFSTHNFYIIQSAYSFSVLLKMYSQILTSGLLAVTSMPIVPGEPESVSGQVKVLDLLRQDGGVPLFPACDGNDVTRLVLR